MKQRRKTSPKTEGGTNGFQFNKSPRGLPIRMATERVNVSLPCTLAQRSAGMGYGNRTKYWAGDSPGAGQYEIKSSFINRDSFSFQARTHPNKPKVSPGPGSYNAKNVMGSESPKYSMRPKHHFRVKSDIPAVGIYSPNTTLVHKNKFAGISQGYGGRYKWGKNPEDPGPGRYCVKGQLENSANASQGFSF